MLQMFTESDTVDDLGIGTVRDAISNALFPGTSVIQTRARYFLFVPWIYRCAEMRFPNLLVDKAADMELRLIEALRRGGDLEGLIGLEAGQRLQIKPSAIYWSGLNRFGIFQATGMSIRQYGRQVARGGTLLDPEDELADRRASFWQQEIPHEPERFFQFEEFNFDLTQDEAQWLSERIISSGGPGRRTSLLESFVTHLGRGGGVPIEASLWDQVLPDSTDASIVDLVGHSNYFSYAVRGAALLYNLMLAERRPTDLDQQESTDVSTYADALAEWSEGANGIDLMGWATDIGSFWRCFSENELRVPMSAKAFVDRWANVIAEDGPAGIDSVRGRDCVRKREFEHKKSQARLANPKRLRAWQGGSGTRRLTYRWERVQQILRDIDAGLARPDSERS